MLLVVDTVISHERCSEIIVWYKVEVSICVSIRLIKYIQGSG